MWAIHWKNVISFCLATWPGCVFAQELFQLDCYSCKKQKPNSVHRAELSAALISGQICGSYVTDSLISAWPFWWVLYIASLWWNRTSFFSLMSDFQSAKKKVKWDRAVLSGVSVCYSDLGKAHVKLSEHCVLAIIGALVRLVIDLLIHLNRLVLWDNVRSRMPWWESYEECRRARGIMVPFQEVLSEVRRVLQKVNPNLLPSVLNQLVEAQIFSAQYYQSFFSENLCDVDVDVDDLARRLALPVWEKWDASKIILSSVLMENEPDIFGTIFL